MHIVYVQKKNHFQLTCLHIKYKLCIIYIYVIQHLHPTSHFSIPSPRPPPLMQWSFSLGGGHRFVMWHHLVASVAPRLSQTNAKEPESPWVHSPEFSGKQKSYKWLPFWYWVSRYVSVPFKCECGFLWRKTYPKKKPESMKVGVYWKHCSEQSK